MTGSEFPGFSMIPALTDAAAIGNSTRDLPALVPRVDPVLGVARQGWPIIGAFVLGAAGVWAAGLALAGWWGVLPGVLAVVVALWCVWFFRDPERRPPAEPGVLVSAADGVVCSVGPAEFPGELGLSGRGTRLSVFMNIFNVHVNRSPAAARVVDAVYTPGRFFNASLDKASEHNERCGVVLELADGRRLTVIQIAGLVARRIVCGVRTGSLLSAGERFGLIRFGSRVDVYLPAGFDPCVRVGDRVRAGETVIARENGERGAR